MAVGKGSMERAAKAIETDTKKSSKEKKVTKSVTVPSKQVMDKLVDQTHSGDEHDKKSNAQIRVGQEMPVYYL